MAHKSVLSQLIWVAALVLVIGMIFSTILPEKIYAADLFDDYISSDGKTVILGQHNENATDLGGIINRYRGIATAVTAILTITMLIFMLIQFAKLGAAGDNETARRKAIGGIFTTGIATALLGGATVVIGFFWNLLYTTA